MATWELIICYFYFVASGVTTPQLRASARSAISTSLDTEERYITVIVKGQQLVRRLLSENRTTTPKPRSRSSAVPDEGKEEAAQEGIQAEALTLLDNEEEATRRLQQVRTLWEVSFNVHVPSKLATNLRANLDTTLEEPADFAAALFNALASQADNITDLNASFVMGEFGASDPDSVVTALIKEVEREEVRLVDELVSGDSSQVTLSLDNGITLLAVRIDASEVASQTEDVVIDFNMPATVIIPPSTFSELGLDIDAVVVVTPLGDARTGEEHQSRSAGEETSDSDEVAIALASVNINVFDVEGRLYSVSGLVEPVLITLALDCETTRGLDVECAYWDEETAAWLNDSVSVVERSCSSITCSTTHFTLFAAIVRGFTGATPGDPKSEPSQRGPGGGIVCLQAELMTSESFQQLAKSKWFFKFSTCIVWMGIAFFVVLLVQALRLDIQRRHLWADGAFLINDDRSVPAVGFEEGMMHNLYMVKVILNDVRSALSSSLRDARGSGLMGRLKAAVCSLTLLFTRHALVRVAHQNACADIRVHDGDNYGKLTEVLGLEKEAAWSPIKKPMFDRRRANKEVSSKERQLEEGRGDKEAKEEEEGLAGRRLEEGGGGSREAAEPRRKKRSRLKSAELEEVSEVRQSEVLSLSDQASIKSPKVRTASGRRSSLASLSSWASQQLRLSLEEQEERSGPGPMSLALSEDENNNFVSVGSEHCEARSLQHQTSRWRSEFLEQRELLQGHLLNLRRVHTVRVAKHHQNIVRALRLPSMVTKPFLTLGPIGKCLVFSIFMRSSTRVLLLWCRVMGGIAVTTFFLWQDGVPSASNPPECKHSPDISTMIGRLVAITLASGVFAEVPVALLGMLHRRRFKAINAPTGSVPWRRQLQRWVICDVLMWFFGLAYVAFCILYAFLFIANVEEEHHGVWLAITGMEVFNLMLVIPLVVSIMPTLLAAAIVGAVAAKHGKQQALEWVLGEDEMIGKNQKGRESPTSSRSPTSPRSPRSPRSPLSWESSATSGSNRLHVLLGLEAFVYTMPHEGNSAEALKQLLERQLAEGMQTQESPVSPRSPVSPVPIVSPKSPEKLRSSGQFFEEPHLDLQTDEGSWAAA